MTVSDAVWWPDGYQYGTGSFPVNLENNAMVPNNGLLTQNTDFRVSQDDLRRVGQAVMHEGRPFIVDQDLAGNYMYTWSAGFISLIQQSFSENKIANFTKDQMSLFQDYLVMMRTGPTGLESNDVLALDNYLGSIKNV